jgi:adenosylcobinamide kinase/adenosylcobinamide-phosphate guanylyltransferase
MLPHLTVVLGGAASGKSDYAESIVRQSSGRRLYIATAQAWDDEMRAKIAAHQRARAEDGWRTVESPLAPEECLDAMAVDEVALLDCATMWLTNHLLGQSDLPAAKDRLFAGLATAPGRVVIVTNEVGAGIVPENALARQFREAQGRLNRDLAARADLVVTVIAGLPLALKGDLP